MTRALLLSVGCACAIAACSSETCPGGRIGLTGACRSWDAGEGSARGAATGTRIDGQSGRSNDDSDAGVQPATGD